MSAKWTNASFKLQDRDKPVPKPTAQPDTQEEVLYQYLRQEWNDDNVNPVSNVDVMYGYPDTETLKEWFSEIFEKFDFVEKAAFVTVTGQMGFGGVFERKQDGIELESEYTGIDGAAGEDVATTIYEDYRIKIDPLNHW